jgi:hypothetical protein
VSELARANQTPYNYFAASAPMGTDRGGPVHGKNQGCRFSDARPKAGVSDPGYN